MGFTDMRIRVWNDGDLSITTPKIDVLARDPQFAVYTGAVK